MNRDNAQGCAATIWTNPNTIDVGWSQCMERAEQLDTVDNKVFWPFSRQMLKTIVDYLQVFPAATLDRLMGETGVERQGVKTQQCITQLTELLPVWCVQVMNGTPKHLPAGFQGPPEGSKQMGRFSK